MISVDRVFMSRLGWICLIAAGTVTRWSVAQEDAGVSASGPDEMSSFLERSQRLVQNMQRLGPWEEQAELIARTGENLFRNYGWNSEADRFAQQLMTEVSQIPPWDFAGRLERASQMVDDRYGFTPEQSQQVRQKVLTRMFEYFGRHSGELFQISEEVISARAERRAFSPQEVARWARMAEPLMVDGLETYERVCSEVEPLLDERQRDILARDRESELRRVRSMMARMEGWKQGRWRPEDWGLQDDPFHRGGAGDESGPSTAGDREVADARIDVPDEDEWVRYVRTFVNRYALDEEQRTAAHAILLDVKTQARVYRSAGDAEGGSGRGAELDERVQAQLFEQLRRRLDQLPTPKQRRAVEGPEQVLTTAPAAVRKSGESDQSE